MKRTAARIVRLLMVVTLIGVVSPTAAGLAAEANVSITSNLTPRNVTVAPGVTVEWINNDNDRHRMRSVSGPEEFDSGNLESGETYTFNFAREGEYSYVDARNEDDVSYHGTITVTSGPVGPPGTTTPPPAQGDIDIINRSYRPGNLTIAEGGTVRWVNRDRDHTVTARDRSWDSGIFGIGGTYQRTFNSAGTFEYFCTLHPDMVGTITVNGGGGTPPPPTTLPPPPPPPPPVGSGDVRIVDFAYEPASLSVDVGATLTWVNAGEAPHTVTANGGGFDSGFMFSGDTFSRTFNSAGTFAYFCTIHPEMTATVTVNGGGGTPPPPTTLPPPPPPPPPVGSGDVKIVDNAFQPGTYRVATGTTVKWINTGAVPHTVTSSSGGFDSGYLFSGDDYRRTFNAVGTYDYVCTLHPGMAGTVIVGGGGTPPPSTTPPGPVDPPEVPPTGPSDVVIVDNAYEPGQIQAAVGQTITWANTGALPHTVTAIDNAFDSSFVMPGGAYQLSFGAPGTYEYFCTIHPEMSGSVVVTGEGSGGPAVVSVTEPREATSSTSAPPTDEGVASASTESSRPTRNVRVIDNAFDPGEVRAEVGQTIRWRNEGSLPHTVTADDRFFDSGILESDAEFRMSFDAAGVYAYVCTLHPEMMGTITVVEPTPTAAVSIVPGVDTTDAPITIAVVLSLAIVAAMAFFTFGMTQFARAADQERGVTRRTA